MALFGKSKSNNLSRANSILEGLAPKEEVIKEEEVIVPVVETPVVVTPPVVEVTEKVIDNIPPVVETPPVVIEDKEVEGVANPNTDKPSPVVPVVETPPTAEVTEELLLAKLSERLGRTVTNFDELSPKEANIDPELKQLQDWKEKTGLSLSEWSNYNRDFSKLSDMDIARELLATENPNFTKEELEYSLDKYVIDEDLDDKNDRLKKSISLKKYAKEGRDKLEANKLELANSNGKAVLTQEQQDSIKLADEYRTSNSTIKQQQEAYNAGIIEASTGLEAIDLRLSDDLTIKYNVPVEVRKNLPKTVAEMPHWYNADGSYNHANVVKDVAKVTNFEAMIEAAYNQGISVGTENRIKVGANIEIDGTRKPATTSTSKGNVSDVVSKIAGSRSSAKLRFRTKKE